MPKPAPEVDVPAVALQIASADAYCRSVLSTPGCEMWWFQTGGAPYRGFSRPFSDRAGRWWWRAKPHFAWPVDFFTPLADCPRPPWFKSALGYQHPAPLERANSLVHFNVIRDLSRYDVGQVASQKRRAVRKGLRSLIFEALDPCAPDVVAEAREVWNSHVERTGWNEAFDAAQFAGHWRPLAQHAGTNIVGVRDADSGALCAWVICRIVEGCAYVDTIASHTERLENRPNDTLIFAALWNAARLPGVRHANYFLRSSLEPLERFKQSLGFDSSGLPARLRVNPLAGAALRALRPAQWRRLVGDWPPTCDTSPPAR
jgi:hypothetical protein